MSASVAVRRHERVVRRNVADCEAYTLSAPPWLRIDGAPAGRARQCPGDPSGFLLVPRHSLRNYTQ